MRGTPQEHPTRASCAMRTQRLALWRAWHRGHARGVPWATVLWLCAPARVPPVPCTHNALRCDVHGTDGTELCVITHGCLHGRFASKQIAMWDTATFRGRRSAEPWQRLWPTADRSCPPLKIRLINFAGYRRTFCGGTADLTARQAACMQRLSKGQSSGRREQHKTHVPVFR